MKHRRFRIECHPIHLEQLTVKAMIYLYYDMIYFTKKWRNVAENFVVFCRIFK